MKLNSDENTQENRQEVPVQAPEPTPEQASEPTPEQASEPTPEQASEPTPEPTLEPTSPPEKKVETSIAHELAKKQRDIGVAEFFARNRHLLGFDNKRKALMTTVKEAVDNSLDACEEAGILPELFIEIIDMGNERYRVTVEDNGPGIIKEQIPKIFGKLLYGSKFHSLKMSRGQQGIGISASVMYGQLTTGRHSKIKSRTSRNSSAQYYEVSIDTKKNMPLISKDHEIEWDKDHGTRIEIDLEGSYVGGALSVDEYLKETAICNPHATIVYTNPKAQQFIFARAIEEIPPPAVEIKPHPYGVELGVLIDMLSVTESRTLQSFLMTDFSRVGAGTAKQICENSALLPKTKPKKVSRDMAEALIKGIKKTKIMAPPTDCISPLGEDNITKGMRKEINAEYYVATTRPPSVYRGNPFIIECGIAYGGEQPGDKAARILRFANRVPLLYQGGACAISKSISSISWRPYGLNQSQNSPPNGPITIFVHMASVWVPFTSESKEAVAHYPEIIKETKLALQECGRKLSSYVRKKKRVKDEIKKRSYIEKYIPHVAIALQNLLGYTDADEMKVEESLKNILERARGQVEDLKFDPTKNADFDEEFAKIGKGSIDEETESDSDEQSDD